MNGWVKLHRKFQSWEWYGNSQMVHLFLHLLLSANHDAKKWQGQTINRGQLATGRKQLSKATGISERSIRTCIKHLKSTGELTSKTTSKYSIITICNYEEYQSRETQIDQQNDQQSDQQPTSNRPQTRSKRIKEESISSNFDSFWQAYPKKQSRQLAQKSWDKIAPSEELQSTILSALDCQKVSEQWQQDNGKYIPLASTWLNQRRWEDETAPEVNQPVSLQLVSGRRVY